MKTSSVFWGFFFIFIGLFFLIEKLNLCEIDFSNYYEYWPLIIILLGISILNLPNIIKKIIATIAALILAVFIMAIIHHSWFPFIEINNDYSHKAKKGKKYYETVDIPFSDNIKFANLEMNAGACSIDFQNPTDKLIEISSGYPTINLDYSIKDSQNIINMVLDLKFKTKLFSNKTNNKVFVKLNENPIWDLDFDVGAVDLDCDLSKFKIRDICIDVGAADVNIKLGNQYNQSYLEINSGASDISISIPKETGCQIESSTGLSSEDFKGFYRQNNSFYTDNFEKSDNKIIIKISGGVSSFKVIKY